MFIWLNYRIKSSYSKNSIEIKNNIYFFFLGNIPPEQRYLAWKKYRVFFLTPQVLANDLSLGKCPSEMLKCIIVDEAHRATKDYAYVQVNYSFKSNTLLHHLNVCSFSPYISGFEAFS